MARSMVQSPASNRNPHDPPPLPLTVGIQGMTCASCVGAGGKSAEAAAGRDRRHGEPGNRDRDGYRRDRSRVGAARHRKSRLQRADRILHPRHHRHDLRQLLGAGGKGTRQGARRARRQREPRHRTGDREAGAGHLGGRADRSGGACRLWRAAAAPSGEAPAAAGTRAARLVAGGAGDRAVAAADRPHARQPVRRALDAAGLAATGTGNAGAVLARRALLSRRLEGAARGQRQHGPAGGGGHQRGVWPERVSAAHPRRRHAPVFRGVGGGDQPGAARQMAGGARQAPDHRGDPRAAGLAPAHRAGAARRRRPRPADRRHPRRRSGGDPSRRAGAGGRR